MNNTFTFNRFKNLLLKDGKMYFRNHGTGLSQMAQRIKNLPAMQETRDPGNVGLIPGSARSLEKGIATHPSILV